MQTLCFMFILILVFSGSMPLQSQVMIKAESGKIYRIAELQTIFADKNNAIVVEALLPVENRLEKYRDVDISENDTLLMVNGRRIESIMDLEKMYVAFKPGDMVKLGVRRSEGLRILSFIKASEEELPRERMVRMEVTSEGGKVKKRVIDEKGNELSDEEAEKLIDKFKKDKKSDGEVKIKVEE